MFLRLPVSCVIVAPATKALSPTRKLIASRRVSFLPSARRRLSPLGICRDINTETYAAQKLCKHIGEPTDMLAM